MLTHFSVCAERPKTTKCQMCSIPTQPKQLCHPLLRPPVRKTGDTNHTSTNASWGVRDTGLPNVHVAFPFVLSRNQEETESHRSGLPRKRNGLTTRETAYHRGEKVKKNFLVMPTLMLNVKTGLQSRIVKEPQPRTLLKHSGSE